MSFLTTLKSRYKIIAKSQIKTKEPIKIEYEIKNEMFIIYVDGISYGVIDHVYNKDQIDLDKVRRWVEETYYSDDYKSSAYTASRLNVTEFEK